MTDIYQILTNLGITYKTFEHAAVHTVKEAKATYSGIPGGRCKNIFLRDKKGKKHFLVIMPADKELDPNVIREREACSKVGGAQPYELEQYLKVLPGAVSPFALLNDEENHVKVFVDDDIYKDEYQHFHPLINIASVLIKTTDLDKFLDFAGNEWERISI